MVVITEEFEAYAVTVDGPWKRDDGKGAVEMGLTTAGFMAAMVKAVAECEVGGNAKTMLKAWLHMAQPEGVPKLTIRKDDIEEAVAPLKLEKTREADALLRTREDAQLGPDGSDYRQLRYRRCRRPRQIREHVRPGLHQYFHARGGYNDYPTSPMRRQPSRALD